MPWYTGFGLGLGLGLAGCGLGLGLGLGVCGLVNIPDNNTVFV